MSLFNVLKRETSGDPFSIPITLLPFLLFSVLFFVVSGVSCPILFSAIDIYFSSLRVLSFSSLHALSANFLSQDKQLANSCFLKKIKCKRSW